MSEHMLMCNIGWGAGLLRAGSPPSGGGQWAAEAAQARAPSRTDDAAGVPRHELHRHATDRALEQIPDRDVSWMPREVSVLLGDLRHG